LRAAIYEAFQGPVTVEWALVTVDAQETESEVEAIRAATHGAGLDIVGSHGMQAHAYPRMLDMIADGRVEPAGLLGETTTLACAAARLHDPDGFGGAGITVIDRF
jgi:threonine dehydrogenase-like Zn-dependent dehydrogenase